MSGVDKAVYRRRLCPSNHSHAYIRAPVDTMITMDQRTVTSAAMFPVESRLSFRDGRIYYDLLTSYLPPRGGERPSARALALYMATRYYRNLPSFCAGLFEAAPGAEGYALRPRGWHAFDLLRVGPPVGKADGDRALVTFPIVGGLLALPSSQSGRFIFEACVCPERVVLLVRVARFSPLIAGDGSRLWRVLLYRWTQSLFHRIIIAGFLRTMVRELTTGSTLPQEPLSCRWMEPPA